MTSNGCWIVVLFLVKDVCREFENLTCSHGCSLSEDDSAFCFCNTGYSLGSDNQTCFGEYHCLIHTSIISIYVISRVCLAGQPASQPSCVAKLKRWILHTNCSTIFFHTCHIYRHHFIPLSLTVTLLVGRSKGQR